MFGINSPGFFSRINYLVPEGQTLAGLALVLNIDLEQICTLKLSEFWVNGELSGKTFSFHLRGCCRESVSRNIENAASAKASFAVR